MDGTSILGAGEILELRQLIRDGLQTMLEFQFPPVTATAEHWNEQTQEWEAVTTGPTLVVLEWANQLAAVQVQDANQGSQVRGEITAFEPFGVVIGDRIMLNTGVVARVIAPEPVHEFGTVVVTIQSDHGGA